MSNFRHYPDDRIVEFRYDDDNMEYIVISEEDWNQGILWGFASSYYSVARQYAIEHPEKNWIIACTQKGLNMRDPQRIDSFCEELARMWHKVPDQRFGQFISNYMGAVYQHTGGRDIFFIEDDEMLQALRQIFKMEDQSWL